MKQPFMNLHHDHIFHLFLCMGKLRLYQVRDQHHITIRQLSDMNLHIQLHHILLLKLHNQLIIILKVSLEPFLI
jgi:hypothetical protein